MRKRRRAHFAATNAHDKQRQNSKTASDNKAVFFEKLEDSHHNVTCPESILQSLKFEASCNQYSSRARSDVTQRSGVLLNIALIVSAASKRDDNSSNSAAQALCRAIKSNLHILPSRKADDERVDAAL